MKHYITKYEENGAWYAESWLQINFFGFCYCFSKKRIAIGDEVTPIQHFDPVEIGEGTEIVWDSRYQ